MKPSIGPAFLPRPVMCVDHFRLAELWVSRWGFCCTCWRMVLFETSPREVGSTRYSADYVSNSDNDNDSPILTKSSNLFHQIANCFTCGANGDRHC